MSGGARRLPCGGRVDRGRPLECRFNGRRHHGLAGDTLASALLANGVRLVGRSFKFHRPRGVMSAGIEETNAIVQLCGDGEPNVLATRLWLTDGLAARSVNCWPGVAFDVGAIADKLWRVLPAGFYNKTFIWPPGFWRFYEYFIRKAAGLGRAPTAAEPARYEKRFHHCDVLVAGAGPAGLTASLAAARSGARVMLVDDQPEPGGDLLNAPAEIDGRTALDWVAAVVGEIDACPDVVRLSDATAFGYYDHNFLGVVEQRPKPPAIRERVWKVRARQVVLATGAIERPLVFADNDRPGVMLASAARAYVIRFGVRPGNTAVVFTNNNGAYGAAFDLAGNGVAVAAIIDVRADAPRSLLDKASALGIEVVLGHAIVGVRGRRQVAGVEAAPLEHPARARRFACDLVCASGGWNPTVNLFSQSGGRLRYDRGRACFVPETSVQAAHCAGAANGAFALGDCLAEGFGAGAAAARAAGYDVDIPGPPAATPTLPLDIEPLWEAPHGRRTAKAFVDVLNDVTTDDIRLAVREGYDAVEHLKRYTTGGMGLDQGKTANANIIGVLAQTLGSDIPAVGTTSFRPPYRPVSLGAIAGADIGPLVRPARRTPMTDWHEAAGAVMYDVAVGWRRPGYYPRPGETMAQAVSRECLSARDRAGMYDSSPLGKFEITGPDATTLLNRIYTNAWDDLAVGRGRYGVMLREDGRVLDDGVTFRLGAHQYLMSSTTGNAELVYAWLERWLQCEWPDFQVFVVPVTTQWANAVVCGPRARETLRCAGTDIDVERDAFPFLAIRNGTVAGFPARVARVSFTGELSFEVNVPARYGLDLWRALMAAGAEFGITPVGSEANQVLRVEKGFFAMGIETDGMATPHDLGLGWIVGKKKTDFVGKRSLARDDAVGGVRRQLVGLFTEDPRIVLPEGSQIAAPDGARTDGAIAGHVTSSVHSPTLGRSIALALLDDGRSRGGETVTIPLPEGAVRATVTRPVFYDPEGARMRG